MARRRKRISQADEPKILGYEAMKGGSEVDVYQAIGEGGDDLSDDSGFSYLANFGQKDIRALDNSGPDNYFATIPKDEVVSEAEGSAVNENLSGDDVHKEEVRNGVVKAEQKERSNSVVGKEVLAKKSSNKTGKVLQERSDAGVEKVGVRVAQAAKSKKSRVSTTTRLNIVFPSGRIYSRMRRLTRLRVSAPSSIAVAAITKYLAEEIFTSAHESMVKQKRRRFTPQSLGMGIQNDGELAELFRNITIPSAGSFGRFYIRG